MMFLSATSLGALLTEGDRLVQSAQLEASHPGRQRALLIVQRGGVNKGATPNTRVTPPTPPPMPPWSITPKKGSPGLSTLSPLSCSAPSSSFLRNRPRAASFREPSAAARRANEAAAAAGNTAHDVASTYYLLGVDKAAEDTETSIGLVFQLMWDAQISLDGDGGFSLRQLGQHFIFKPVSVKALWTIIQTLHMIVAEQLRPRVGGASGPTAAPPSEDPPSSDLPYKVTSAQSCINEWHYMADVLVRRPASPGRSREDDIESVIKTELRTIMKSVNLDSITSKSIRTQLESRMARSLDGFKSFIDKEILLILGQMDPASQILPYLYLGSEWNASNLEELRANGITHVLNVTREIDNFFPASFVYTNIREYDEEATDLLKYLDRTYKFVKGAKEEGGKVLIHCKMGISRSATVTISYIMKEHNENLEETLSFVRSRRSIVKPNKSFLKQLEVYEGILTAIRHRHTYFSLLTAAGNAQTGAIGLYRSKSESSLVPSSPCSAELDSPMSPCSGAAGFRDSSPVFLGDISSPSDDTTGKTKSVKKSSIADSIRIDFKALSSVFMESPSKSSSEEQRKSVSPSETRKIVIVEKDDEGEPIEVDDCKCFGEVSEVPMSSEGSNSFVEATNPHLKPVNTSAIDPDCNCDVEFELGVPEEPVVIQGSEEADEQIVQNMSNLPLQLRAAGQRASSDSNHSLTPPVEFRRRPSAESMDDSDETSAAMKRDELSVKTLANMFDFKGVNAVPLRPCSARLEDSHLFQKGKRLSGAEEAATRPKEATQSDC